MYVPLFKLSTEGSSVKTVIKSEGPFAKRITKTLDLVRP